MASKDSEQVAHHVVMTARATEQHEVDHNLRIDIAEALDQAYARGLADGRKAVLPSEDDCVAHLKDFLRHSSNKILCELTLMTHEELMQLNSTAAAIRATHRHILANLRTEPSVDTSNTTTEPVDQTAKCVHVTDEEIAQKAYAHGCSQETGHLGMYSFEAGAKWYRSQSQKRDILPEKTTNSVVDNFEDNKCQT